MSNDGWRRKPPGRPLSGQVVNPAGGDALQSRNPPGGGLFPTLKHQARERAWIAYQKYVAAVREAMEENERLAAAMNNFARSASKLKRLDQILEEDRLAWERERRKNAADREVGDMQDQQRVMQAKMALRRTQRELEEFETGTPSNSPATIDDQIAEVNKQRDLEAAQRALERDRNAAERDKLHDAVFEAFLNDADDEKKRDEAKQVMDFITSQQRALEESAKHASTSGRPAPALDKSLRDANQHLSELSAALAMEE